MLTATVHDSIREIDASAWDEIVEPERIYQTHAWLSLLENDGLVDCPPKYFVIRQDGKIVAHLTAYMIETSLLVFSQGVANTIVEKVRSIKPNFMKPRILECGSPVCVGNPLSMKKEVDNARVIALLCNSIELTAANEGIRIIAVRDFLDHELAAHLAFEEHGYSRVHNLPTTVLPIRWKSFDEYLADMRKRPRQALRYRFKHAAESQLTTRLRTDFSGLAEQLAQQLKNVDDHAREVSREVISAEFYRNIGATLGENCRLIEVVKGEHLISHVLIVNDGTTLRPLRFGKSESNARDGAYFLAVARVVQLAIEERMSLIDLGLTTYLAKTDFGAKMVPLWMFVRIRGPFGKALVKLFQFLNPVPSLMERKIFKEKQASPSASSS